MRRSFRMKEFKELLEECKEFVADDPDYYGLELSTKEVRLVVEALEKQVEKKPLIFFDLKGDFYLCNECETDVLLTYKFCPECGYKIDWSEK